MSTGTGLVLLGMWIFIGLLGASEHVPARITTGWMRMIVAVTIGSALWAVLR